MKKLGHTGVQVRSQSLRRPRPLPPKENPLGVPRAVMKQLAHENLTSDPVLWNRRLAELLNAYEKNGG
jgi:hypothetical protein